MSMVDRYLASVAWALPHANRDDIISELRDDILSRIEAVEEAHGRPATDEEIAAILRATGHPATVAARYSGQSGLLPPEAVPWYWSHVRALAALIAVLYAAGGLLSIIGGQSAVQAIVQTIVQGMGSFMSWFGVLTLVYLAFIRYAYPPLLRGWNPAHLPPATPDRKPGTASLAIGIAFGVLFLLLWTGAMSLPGSLSGLLAGPVWAPLYWPVLAVMVLVIVQSVVELVLPRNVRLAAVLAAVASIGTIAIAIYALRGQPPLVTMEAGAPVSAGAVIAVGVINAIGPFVLVIVVIAHLFQGWGKARAALRAGW